MISASAGWNHSSLLSVIHHNTECVCLCLAWSKCNVKILCNSFFAVCVGLGQQSQLCPSVMCSVEDSCFPVYSPFRLLLLHIQYYTSASLYYKYIWTQLKMNHQRVSFTKHYIVSFKMHLKMEIDCQLFGTWLVILTNLKEKALTVGFHFKIEQWMVESFILAS